MSAVVVAWVLMERDSAVLLCRRKDESPPFAGQWVLPGDRMRAAESAAETLRRVAASDLGVAFDTEEFVDTFFATAEGEEYAVNVFRPVSLEGRPRYRQGGPYAEARWVPLSDLGPIAPAPQELIQMLQGKRHWPEADARPVEGQERA